MSSNRQPVSGQRNAAPGRMPDRLVRPDRGARQGGSGQRADGSQDCGQPQRGNEAVDEVCTQIVLQLFHLSAEYLDASAARRDALVAYAERFIVRLFSGAMMLAQLEPGRAPARRNRGN